MDDNGWKDAVKARDPIQTHKVKVSNFRFKLLGTSTKKKSNEKTPHACSKSGSFEVFHCRSGKKAKAYQLEASRSHEKICREWHIQGSRQ